MTVQENVRIEKMFTVDCIENVWKTRHEELLLCPFYSSQHIKQKSAVRGK